MVYRFTEYLPRILPVFFRQGGGSLFHRRGLSSQLRHPWQGRRGVRAMDVGREKAPFAGTGKTVLKGALKTLFSRRCAWSGDNRSSLTKPEVKSPAGYWPQLRAAIDAGADAVYFGLTHFTARAKSGFTLAELPEVFRTLHSRGVKGYVTFNTLIFDDELKEAARGLAAIAESGADAIIVQDWAAVKLAREIAPSLAIHGSTQMSITDAAGARHAQDLGVDRLILARELSLEQIAQVRKETDVELEIFCHGALCVSYSGQCFSSEAWGGRSANRGQCAQACRLPYEMIVDGRVEPLGDARYLLSPGDLYALALMPKIVEMGISALKIEGRYKDADYVALTTRAYREAVDSAAQTISREALEQVYSRGLGPWFLSGTNHQTVVRGRVPRHRGLEIGAVTRITPTNIVIRPFKDRTLKPGDGVVFDAADWRSPQQTEEGGRLYEVTNLGKNELALAFANHAIDSSRIHPGDLVWRTDDPDIAKLVKSMEPSRQSVDIHVEAHTGAPILLTWTLPNATVTVQSDDPLQHATNRALEAGYLADQLGRLGGTPYKLGNLTTSITGSPFAPPSLLNQLRRDAVERLQAEQTRPHTVELREPTWPQPTSEPAPTIEPQLHLLVRDPSQLDAALEAQPASITLDYLDLYGLKPSLERVKASGIEARIASPRVLKPGEEKIADFLRRCDAPILVRPAGLMTAFAHQVTMDGDFSLNAANAISADLLLANGLRRLTPTHDLNALQIAKLAALGDPARIEAVAYHHLPVFHTEHCVFCRFLSTGTSFKDCGRPCEHHQVALRDTSGRAHAVIADIGCRNTIFGAEAQEASAHLDQWLAAGIRHFRLEFVHEPAHRVTAITEAFRDYFNHAIKAPELSRRLKQLAPEGTTEGSLYVPASAAPFVVLQ
jgi:putative protease